MLKQILQQLNTSSDYLKLFKAIEDKKNISVFGTTLSDSLFFLAGLEGLKIYVVNSLKEAQKVREYFLQLNKRVGSIYQGLSGYIYQSDTQNQLAQDYYVNLFKILKGQLDILIVTPEVLRQKLPSKEAFLQNCINLKKGLTYDINMLSASLVSKGYRRVSLVEQAGDFSLRGDILDIFIVGGELPTRLQFFDEELEGLKTFNPITYASAKEVDEVDILPNTLFFASDKEVKKIQDTLSKNLKDSSLAPNYFVRLNNIVQDVVLNLNFNSNSASLFWCLPFLDNYKASIFDYLKDRATLAFCDAKLIFDELNFLEEEFSSSIKTLLLAGEVLKEHKDFYFSTSQVLLNLEKTTKIAFQSINHQNKLFAPEGVFSLRTSPVINYSKNYKLLIQSLKTHKKEQKTVILSANNDTSSVFLEKMLKENDISCQIISTPTQIKGGQINIINFSIPTGFILIQEALVVIGVQELFSKSQIYKPKTRRQKGPLTLPKVGEYVVHDLHGIGLCVGTKRLRHSGYEKDYILIKYAGEDMLYLPTEQVELISSYIGSEETPKLSKIGGYEFSKQKEKVKESIREMAINLVDLYVKRQTRKGFYFEKDDDLQKEFERSFMYAETEDQLQAIEDVKKDMQSGKIMDRLICGDVGYGKTEVALRAAFKAILSNKQVAFLAPTTILANQHYNTCRARMSDFLVNCDILSRFSGASRTKESLKNLAEGKTDIICGTHKLLSKNVKFKDLGLLILDEEQRFGVADKEKIKALKKDVDVITMSATPIPRTLHMSMIGIRDISLIETPPQNRLPVQTFVVEYSSALLEDAINKELLRKGQVLIVHNRVETIDTVFSKLKNLFPKVNIGLAHGQMPTKNLEKVIQDLYDGKIQVLLSTTLIENGIDLPDANTLIVLDSDRLGLSQLYQLRGRVGRSSRLGYAYFTFKKDKNLTENAYKRLRAIGDFTELGSGFKIAMRDLEIRGAGNILGREQHGHMGKVGYDMYCKILEESIKELKGQKQKVLKDIKIEVELNSYVPSEYIDNDESRFHIYTSLNTIKTQEEQDSILNKLEETYGKVPPPLFNLALIARIKNLGQSLDIKQIIINNKTTRLIFWQKDKVLSQNINTTLSEFKNLAVLKFEKDAIIEFDQKGASIFKKLETVLNFLDFCTRN